MVIQCRTNAKVEGRPQYWQQGRKWPRILESLYTIPFKFLWLSNKAVGPGCWAPEASLSPQGNSKQKKKSLTTDLPRPKTADELLHSFNNLVFISTKKYGTYSTIKRPPSWAETHPYSFKNNVDCWDYSQAPPAFKKPMRTLQPIQEEACWAKKPREHHCTSSTMSKWQCLHWFRCQKA